MAGIGPGAYIPGIVNNRRGRVLRYFLMLPMLRLGNFLPLAPVTNSPKAARRD
ncbi:MAG TPA: hypothetical protein VEB20_11915 [Azospirillaceae bacterium]|nr:hypothetical protein [Azospirillaceae bacterium]